MLKPAILVSAVLMLIMFSGLSYSQDSIKVASKFSDEEINLNYLAGVKAANLGLKVSAAYYLGERKSQRSVIPLMNMLHTDKNPEARIMAALSLYKIGDARGILAIQGASEEDADVQVQHMCKILYQMHEMENRQKK